MAPILLFLAATAVVILPQASGPGAVLLDEDFEGRLERWDVTHPTAVRIVDSGDSAHRRVLALEPDGPSVFALVRGGALEDVRIEGEFFFPGDEAGELTVVFNYVEREGRADFGSAHIDAGSGTVRIDPHRGLREGGTLYQEYRSVIETLDLSSRKWRRFAAEVIGSECHLYVGDMSVPRATFDLHQPGSGRLGLAPEGTTVWIDNVRITRIGEFSYGGPSLPTGIDYRPEALLTEWRTLGPFTGPVRSIEEASFDPTRAVRDGRRTLRWRPFPTDPRGAVLTDRVVDARANRFVAYFHTRVESPTWVNAALQISSVDELTIWLNGKLVGRVRAQQQAWYDFWENPEHAGAELDVFLRPGRNDILVRSRALGTGPGGFFARLDPGR